MISKNDCLLLLTELEDKGVDTKETIKKLMVSRDIPLEVLKFINDRRQLDLAAFYEKLRKNYNNKKSNLYINIVRVDEQQPKDIITVLASLNLQIILFAEKVEDKQMFLKHARAREISLMLAKYFTDYDLTGCIKLLTVVKADLKCLEAIKG